MTSQEHNELFINGASFVELLKSILDRCNLPVVIFSYPDFSVVDMNRMAMSLLDQFEIPVASNIAEGVLKRIDATSRREIVKLIRKILRNDSSRGSATISAETENGTRSFNCVIIPFAASTFGKIGYLISVISPLALCNEAVPVQMNESFGIKEEELSYIAHELKTPISIIVSAVQSIEALTQTVTPKTKKYFDIIKRNANKQVRLIKNILDASKARSNYLEIHKKNIEIVAYTRAIIESVHTYATDKNLNIRFNTLLACKITAMDAEKYERILLNLLSNAIKYTPPGRYIIINLSKIRGCICLEVKDEGEGIDEEKLKSIFKPFYRVDNKMTGNAEGTGLGLFLVLKFVKALGGNIEIDSVTGKGTSLRIYFEDEAVVEDGEAEIYTYNEDNLKRLVSIEFSNL